MGGMTASAQEHPKLRYFHDGREAFAKLGLGVPPYYVCPLCLHGFTEGQTQSLTREHVPPRAVGGRRIVLTCLDCNNIAGHDVDSHAAEFERIRDFSHRKSGVSFMARYRAEGGLDVNVSAEWSPDGALSLTCLPASNSPGAAQGLNDELTRRWREGKGWPNSQLSFRLRHRVSLRRANISWLRAAYLVAFAVLGYRYALRQELDLARIIHDGYRI